MFVLVGMARKARDEQLFASTLPTVAKDEYLIILMIMFSETQYIYQKLSQ